jgi:hypothetical protein
MHGIAFVALSFTLVPMYLFMWRHLRRSPGWESFGRYSLVMGLLTVPAEVGSIRPDSTLEPFRTLGVATRTG